jgi:sec-independent protein translocase protein TatA
MGIGGISIWQLVIILVIVLLLFGTKRLRGLGGDLGSAIKGFKKAVKDDQNDTPSPDEQRRVDAGEPLDGEPQDIDPDTQEAEQKQKDHSKI